MRAPEFWSGTAEGRDKALLLQALATPVSWLYAAGSAWRIKTTKPHKVAAPVICIGNVSVGGVGKTPLVRTVRELLAASSIRAAVVARGHGGRLKGPVVVDPHTHTAVDVGDEPLLHARDGLTVIGRDRVAAAELAIAAGAQAILLDDGFQNPTLHKDFSILAFDAASGLGNGKVLPAGPLREQLSAALPRADAAVMIGHGPKLALGHLPTFAAAIEPTGSAPAGPLVAFAGIGRPEKFFDTLIALGATISEAVPFADHHPFTASDLEFLAKLAAERGAQLICTEKDHVRLPADWRTRVLTLPVRARLADPAGLIGLLNARLGIG